MKKQPKQKNCPMTASGKHIFVELYFNKGREYIQETKSWVFSTRAHPKCSLCGLINDLKP